MVDFNFKKTFVCYKTILSDSEVEWKEKNKLTNQMETENLKELIVESKNDFTDKNEVFKTITCRCKTINALHNNVVMARCRNCQEVLCFSCNVSFL